jgi:hypothetical protein
MKRGMTSCAVMAATALLAVGHAATAVAQGPLASGELRIVGVKLVVSPANQTVPKNQATKSRVLGCYVVRLLGGAR